MKKIYFETYGCAVNQADTETMQGILQKNGFKIINGPDKADIIIINSCIVKGPTLNKILTRIKRLKQQNKRILLAGCISQSEPNLIKDIPLIGTDSIKKITDAVNETLQGNIVKFLKRSKHPRLNLPKIRRNKIIEIIPISQGCLGKCSYCKVRFARGELFSYDPKAILRQIKSAVNDGVKELWITSQDTGTYGLDIGTNIIELLKEILALRGNFKVRLGMINPNYVKQFSDEFLEIFNDDKMFRFMHIPLQSGSDKVLKDMKRQYMSKDFLDVCARLRKRFIDFTISTDIICGYPTESEIDFIATKKIILDAKPDVINISQFYPMKGTEAASLTKLEGRIVKERSREMTKISREVRKKNNNEWIGWEDIILIDEKGKNDSFIGRNFAYKPVILEKNKKIKIGDIVKVKIKSATSNDLRAVLLDNKYK